MNGRLRTVARKRFVRAVLLTFAPDYPRNRNLNRAKTEYMCTSANQREIGAIHGYIWTA